MAGWHFVTLSKNISAKINKEFNSYKRGWGSLKVSVEVGKSNWKTSIFPDKKSGCYLLPLKSEIRKKENIIKDKLLKFKITVLT